jgi:hypothetical protein
MTSERCPLPGCENPAGTGKTGACSGAHAAKIGAAARAHRARISALNAPSKKQQRADEQRRAAQREALKGALRDRERSVVAAYRAQ